MCTKKEKKTNLLCSHLLNLQFHRSSHQKHTRADSPFRRSPILSLPLPLPSCISRGKIITGRISLNNPHWIASSIRSPMVVGLSFEGTQSTTVCSLFRKRIYYRWANYIKKLRLGWSLITFWSHKKLQWSKLQVPTIQKQKGFVAELFLSLFFFFFITVNLNNVVIMCFIYLFHSTLTVWSWVNLIHIHMQVVVKVKYTLQYIHMQKKLREKSQWHPSKTNTKEVWVEIK